MKNVFQWVKTFSPVDFPAGRPVPGADIPPAAAGLFDKYGRKFNINWELLSDAELLKKAQAHFAVKTLAAGAYLAEFDPRGLTVYSATERGCFYALQGVLTKLELDGFRSFVLFESPRGSCGIKLYLPEPTDAGFRDFRRVIDLAARCKCSFVMLELGGALEYKSHPEINQAWVEYCSIMNEYPGKTLDIQNKFPWRKNSIHSENGGGKFLTQEQFMSLVDYCRKRFMEVIPEMPSLSHSDYLLYSHRELAERAGDPFPDTCCPLDPGYHRLYFELLDEVIELMQPQKLNFGHDEFYTMNQCPRCRGKDPVKLYADDVNTIAGYLRAKNVEPVIWGEKLLDSHWRTGEPIGGAAIPESDNLEALPAIYPAAELIENVTIMHWYWTVDRQLDKVYEKKNMPYYFANLSPAMVKDWEKRISAPLVKGCCVSNWGELSMRTLQRNGVLYDMVYTSLLMWNSALGEADFDGIDQTVFKLLYDFRSVPAQSTKQLEVTHTVETDVKFQYFFDGFLLDESTFYLGEHCFADKTGRKLRFPVIMGSNISNSHVLPQRGEDPEQLRDSYVYDLQHTEVAGECLKTVDDSGKVWYTCRFDLPDEVENLTCTGFEAAAGRQYQVELKTFSIK